MDVKVDFYGCMQLEVSSLSREWRRGCIRYLKIYQENATSVAPKGLDFDVMMSVMSLLPAAVGKFSLTNDVLVNSI